MPSLKYRPFSSCIILSFLILSQSKSSQSELMKITLEINMAGDIMMIPASKYSRAANNYSIKAGILVTLHPHTGPAYHY